MNEWTSTVMISCFSSHKGKGEVETKTALEPLTTSPIARGPIVMCVADRKFQILEISH